MNHFRTLRSDTQKYIYKWKHPHLCQNTHYYHQSLDESCKYITIRFSSLFFSLLEKLSQGSQAFHCSSIPSPSLFYCRGHSSLSCPTPSSLPLPSRNSDYGCCFIGSLHFSLLLRLMVCCAIKDSAKSGHSMKEGTDTICNSF